MPRPRAASLRNRPFFCIFHGMKLDINPRGNGACPICVHNDQCRLQKALAKSLNEFSGMEMEIVIYECPQFKEKD